MDGTRAHEDPAARAARDAFGIPYIYPWQRLVIANVLDAVAAETRARQARESGEEIDDGETLFDEDGARRGRQIVLLPTGAGKSLCFQVPALLLGGPTLVVYPLLALMSDQARRLDAGGLEPALFRGGQSPEEREAQFARLEGRDGKPPARLVIANPEVLAGKRLRERIAARGIAHLAIDEAHCVAEWGDSFRPAYLTLGDLARELDPPAVTAFTATASPPVLSRVAEILFGGEAHLVRGETDRPNIRFSVNRCFTKEAALYREVARRKTPMIVFCSTRGGTERTARSLAWEFPRADCRYYHAGLSREEKKAVEDWFPKADNGILCATCAWGMGIDTPHVRTVIHKNPPPSTEAYLQEAGRAGRDGEAAEAVMLWSPLDGRKFALLPSPVDRARGMKLVECAESGDCRRERLLSALGDPRTGPDAPGGERLACSGCDVCEGTARDSPGDIGVVASFIEGNSGEYTEGEAAEILYRSANRVSVARLGFPAWRRADFTAMLAYLLRNGKIGKREGWPREGTLRAAKPDARAKGLNLPLRPRPGVFQGRPWNPGRAAGTFAPPRDASGNGRST